MSAGCGTVDPEALVLSLLGTADCQAGALGSEGWHALATSGMFATVLTGLLTLAVARQGYRMLAATGGVEPGEWVALMLRFGVVIALCTSWAAYDRLIYRIAMDGPSEVAAIVFPSAGIETRSLGARLQNAYDAIVTPPDPPVEEKAAAQQTAEAVVSPGAAVNGAGSPGSDRQSAATLLVVTGAGAWIATRLALALLLAIGPFAIVTALFDVSAGLSIGWARAVIGMALAGLVVPLVLALELALLEGPVRAAARTGSADIPGLGAIVWSFTLVMAAMLFVVHRLAGGLRLPKVPRLAASGGTARSQSVQVTPPAMNDRARPAASVPVLPVPPSRALAIAHAAQARTLSLAASRHATTSRTDAPSAAPVPRRGAGIADDAQRSTAARRTPSTKRLEARP